MSKKSTGTANRPQEWQGWVGREEGLAGCGQRAGLEPSQKSPPGHPAVLLVQGQGSRSSQLLPGLPEASGHRRLAITAPLLPSLELALPSGTEVPLAAGSSPPGAHKPSSPPLPVPWAFPVAPDTCLNLPGALGTQGLTCPPLAQPSQSCPETTVVGRGSWHQGQPHGPW